MTPTGRLAVLHYIFFLAFGPALTPASAETKKITPVEVTTPSSITSKPGSRLTDWILPTKRGDFYICPDGIAKATDVDGLVDINGFSPKQISQLMRDQLLDFHFVAGPPGKDSSAISLASLLSRNPNLRNTDFLKKA